MTDEVGVVRELHCVPCGETKPETDFYRNRGQPTGRQTQCKNCAQAYNRRYYWRHREKLMAEGKARYTDEQRLDMRRRTGIGISSKRYDEMLEAQRGKCGICEEPCSSGRNLAVDHDHSCCPGKKSCGKCVRGLLCARCNPGLGQFRDDPRLLLKAVEYLERTVTV